MNEGNRCRDPRAVESASAHPWGGQCSREWERSVGRGHGWGGAKESVLPCAKPELLELWE